MQQEKTALESGPGSTSFAGLLACLTAARPQKATDWLSDSSNSLDSIKDDVVKLSYERALETHARYKPAAGEPASRAPRENQAAACASVSGVSASDPGILAGREANSNGKRKCASVTVRMSEREAAQLQQRAAEAGMTVSAYLRSCTFEVEALRAQVKQALTALRAAQTAPSAPSITLLARRSWLHLFRRPVS